MSYDSSFLTYHQGYITTGAISWAGTVYPSSFSGVCVAQSLAFCVMFCWSLSVLWFMASDYPLVSSNFSYLYWTPRLWVKCQP